MTVVGFSDLVVDSWGHVACEWWQIAASPQVSKLRRSGFENLVQVHGRYAPISPKESLNLFLPKILWVGLHISLYVSYLE